MKSIIDTNVLRYKLSRARLCKEVPSTKLLDPPLENSEGLQYLIDNVLKPMMNDQRVHSADLDFALIEENDIDELGEYYIKYFSDRSQEWRMLKKVYDTCRQAYPLTVSVPFI